VAEKMMQVPLSCSNYCQASPNVLMVPSAPVVKPFCSHQQEFDAIVTWTRGDPLNACACIQVWQIQFGTVVPGRQRAPLSPWWTHPLAL